MDGLEVGKRCGFFARSALMCGVWGRQKEDIPSIRSTSEQIRSCNHYDRGRREGRRRGMTYEEWGRVEFPARTVRKELYADWTADRAAAVEVVRELRGEVEALLIMMDRAPKQQKLDDALSWKE